MLEWLRQPWPWYVGGPLLGLIVPALMLLGNRRFGISSTFRHTCAACFPGKIPLFQYDWKRESWSLLFVGGIFLGALVAATLLADPNPVVVDERLLNELAGYGIEEHSRLLPAEIFSLEGLLSLRGIILLAGGGFLVGFGTRYAGGCTSGHTMYGLSTLQWPSLVATIAFLVGGLLSANLLLPLILPL